MTFNLAGSFDDDEGENAWSAGRRSRNLETLRRYAPDVVGFQELQSGNLDTYQAELPDYAYFIGHTADNEPFLYNALFWKTAVLDLVEAGSFWLSETPDAYSRSWESADVRVATWAKLRVKQTGNEFLIINTHLDHISEQARMEGGLLMMERLVKTRPSQLPVILLGDFNCNAFVPHYPNPVETTFTDTSYRFFIQQGFVDTYLACGNHDSHTSNTYHGYEGDAYQAPHGHMAWRIDWILTLNGTMQIKPLAAKIIHDHTAGLYPSDHYPLVAEIELS